MHELASLLNVHSTAAEANLSDTQSIQSGKMDLHAQTKKHMRGSTPDQATIRGWQEARLRCFELLPKESGSVSAT